jgi:hypothetical protein
MKLHFSNFFKKYLAQTRKFYNIDTNLNFFLALNNLVRCLPLTTISSSVFSNLFFSFNKIENSSVNRSLNNNIFQNLSISSNNGCSNLILLKYYFPLCRKLFTIKYASFFLKEKRKLLLSKYFQLFHSLKLSVYFGINMYCTFISCFSFFNKQLYKFYKKLRNMFIQQSKFRRTHSYLLSRLGFIFLLSFRFKQFSLFMRYLLLLFLKNYYRQFLVINFFKLLLQKGILHYDRQKLLGIQFSLNGKMNRRPRARQILFFQTKPPFQDIQLKVLYYTKQLTTVFGVYNFRLWLYGY